MEQQQRGMFEGHILSALEDADPGHRDVALQAIPPAYFAMAQLEALHRIEGQVATMQALCHTHRNIFSGVRLREAVTGALVVLAAVGAVWQWGIDLVRGMMGR